MVFNKQLSMRLTTVMFFLLLLGGIAVAQGPAWWTDRGVITANTANDNAPVVLGQLKKIADEVYNELMEKAPLDASNSARVNLETQLSTWLSDGVNNAVANIGQVKKIGSLVHAWLVEIDHPDAQSFVIHANDSAPALIGQLKRVFGFDAHMVVAGDLNGDGQITSADSTALSDVLADSQSSTGLSRDSFEAADLNEDGILDAKDLALIQGLLDEKPLLVIQQPKQ